MSCDVLLTEKQGIVQISIQKNVPRSMKTRTVQQNFRLSSLVYLTAQPMKLTNVIPGEILCCWFQDQHR